MSGLGRMAAGAGLLLALAQAVSAADDKPQREQFLAQAQAGNADAQYALGMSYCCGNGPGLDTQQAVRWLCRAALQGHKDAAFALAQYYAVRPKSKPFMAVDTHDYAYLWYTVANEHGHPLALAYRTALADDMPASAIRRAEDWARDPAAAGCP